MLLPSLIGQSKLLIFNTGWLVGTEILAKATRVLVIFTLAAILTPVEYGIVMLALASHEIFKLLQRAGAGPQIIQCDDSQLIAYLQTGKVLQWGLGFALMLVQSSVSVFLASYYAMPQLIELLSGMALVYAFYPLVSLNVFLLQRDNQMRSFSMKNALCIVMENASIAAFAMMDLGIMSVVYAKWVFAVCWLCAFARSNYDIPAASLCWRTLKSLLAASGKILLAELFRALKNQADMFVGAKMLSPEVFGLYSFAKTAGVNLGQSLSSAFNAAVYPFLCSQRRRIGYSDGKPVYMLCLLLSALFVVQAISVGWYVPLLFSQAWQQEYLIISLLCLTNIPIVLLDTQCNQYRAKGDFHYESFTRAFCLLGTVCFFSLWTANSAYDQALGLLLINTFLLSVLLLPLCRINHPPAPVYKG